jgi:hypothetical protein
VLREEKMVDYRTEHLKKSSLKDKIEVGLQRMLFC